VRSPLPFASARGGRARRYDPSPASLIDGAFAVCTALDAAGFTAILCGGSAATFYAPGAYVSADNDFVHNAET
jgi:hypothetical protein